MKRAIKMFFFALLLTFPLLSTNAADDYCPGILRNAMDAGCGDNAEAFAFWMSFYIDYCL